MPRTTQSARTLALCLFIAWSCPRPACAVDWVGLPSVTFDRDRGAWVASFELDEPADVEVAILDERDRIVRHLAAGVLGADAPPPLQADSLRQRIEWDGRDDFGSVAAPGGGWRLRVRAGMGASLERIVGGDPYAFFSQEMGQGDHAAWRITGLEAKPDGSVYVMGNANNYGPPAIRQYDARGNYRRTVFPPPPGKPLDAVKGWGVNVRADGTWTPKYNDLSSPALSTTLIGWTRGGCASLMPTPDTRTLTLRRGNQQMTIAADGTLGEYRPGPVIAEPDWPDNGLFGPFFWTWSPDGKALYVSGLLSGQDRYGSVLAAHTSGFWRDGQVWKVDPAARKASVFFALDEGSVIGEMAARGSSPIGHTRSNPYAAFHGVAVDAEGRVFVCDRQNRRIAAVSPEGRLLREIPCANPDAIALRPNSRTLYVTARHGDYHRRGELKLLKFADWTKDGEPAASVTLAASGVGVYPQNSHLAVCVDDGEVLVWVAYTTLPVRVYRDTDGGFELVKDFYQAGPQRALDLQHFVVDQASGDLYVSDGFGSCFRINDWSSPRLVRCMQDANTPLKAVSIAIDARNRLAYTHSHMGPILRYRLGGEYLTPAPAGQAADNAVTPHICNDWRIGLGMGDRGLAVGPDGGLAVLGAIQKGGADYSGPLSYFKADPAAAPWPPLRFERFGKPRSGGVRFDARGNLYVGRYDGKPADPPSGFEKDANFLASTGRICKFAPTGSVRDGNLFPTEPDGPARVYNVHYGVIGPVFSRTPRFGVDGFGRIYYPTSLLPQVSVVDNHGNAILRFGTYGNRDSMGGLDGDLAPTGGIPMAWPNSVDATDEHIYVSDIVNIRLLRIRKTFRLDRRIEFGPG